MCNICGKTFIFKESCQKHKQTYHYNELEKEQKLKKIGGNEKKFCDICNLMFENTEGLKEHNQEKHIRDNLKCCSYCDKKFNMWLNLKCHIDKKHPEHGERTHLCDFCGKGFIFEDSCKNHKRLVNHTSDV